MEDMENQNSHQTQRFPEIANAIRSAVVQTRSENGTIEQAVALAQDYIDCLDEAQGKVTLYAHEVLCRAVRQAWEQAETAEVNIF